MSTAFRCDKCKHFVDGQPWAGFRDMETGFVIRGGIPKGGVNGVAIIEVQEFCPKCLRNQIVKTCDKALDRIEKARQEKKNGSSKKVKV